CIAFCCAGFVQPDLACAFFGTAAVIFVGVRAASGNGCLRDSQLDDDRIRAGDKNRAPIRYLPFLCPLTRSPAGIPAGVPTSEQALRMRDYSYALITAAKNEQSYIRQILQSVVNQTQLPRIWVIVSDASTDLTDEFVLEFARDYDFIRLLRLNNKGTRAFSRQAFAFNA